MKEKPSHDILQDLDFCVFDLETTGGNHKSDKIIEIGLVKIKNLEVVDQINYLINPEIKIPEFIQKLTSISESDVENRPTIEKVIDDILDFMGDSILVAHNTSFDVPFFNSVLKRLKKEEIKSKSICTNLMTKYLIPDLMSSNLKYMCKIFGIKHNNAHRALDDAMATAELFLKYLHFFIKKDIKKVNNLYYPRNKFELNQKHFQSKSSLKEIKEELSTIKSPALLTVKGDQGVILFALPLQGTNSEVKFIMDSIKELEWKIITIRLYGSLTEALLNTNTPLSKAPKNQKIKIINFLWEENLPSKKNSPSTISGIEETGEFVITHHLVPEQLVLVPIKALFAEHTLTFRYPGHKKKLVQFLSSKATKINTGRIKKPYFFPPLKSFVENYLTEASEKESGMLFIKDSEIAKEPEKFYQTIESFLSSHPNTYEYPKKYI